MRYYWFLLVGYVFGLDFFNGGDGFVFVYLYIFVMFFYDLG